MAQEMARIDDARRRFGWAARSYPDLETKQHDHLETPDTSGLSRYSSTILAALGDESSRRILTAAMATGKTVEEISAEENLPLSTCYRRVRQFLDGGLMVLERLILTKTGKRYAIYRTSFTRATISFSGEGTGVEATPNLDVVDKLRTKLMSANYPARNQGVDFWDSVDARQKG